MSKFLFIIPVLAIGFMVWLFNPNLPPSFVCKNEIYKIKWQSGNKYNDGQVEVYDKNKKPVTKLINQIVLYGVGSINTLESTDEIKKDSRGECLEKFIDYLNTNEAIDTKD